MSARILLRTIENMEYLIKYGKVFEVCFPED